MPIKNDVILTYNWSIKAFQSVFKNQLSEVVKMRDERRSGKENP